MPYNKTLIDLFYEQVNETPDEIAIIFENDQLTFKELDKRSDQLGHYLRELGIKKNTFVPILFNRSLEMIISIWAIMKIGAAYVPIDPEYPIERIQFMLDDIQASFIVTKSDLKEVTDQFPNLTNINVDDIFEVLEPVSTKRIKSPTAEQLAYIIYTSGSTGKPKGVMVSHRAIVNRLLWGKKYFKPQKSDLVLQKTTYCFDVSIGELIWPTIVGARLILAVPNGHKDIAYLKNIIEERQITIVHFVPSMLDLFLTEINQGDCSSLKQVLCSGEALKPAHVNLLQKKLPQVALHNLYGPTEAAIEVSYWSLFPDDKREVNVVPIGKAVDNTQLFILDNDEKQVSGTEIGELHIGGIQLSNGYLNRPELTEEKFITSPFGPSGSTKLYKTGDLARWLPDGDVEYVGRTDDQVKIRGFRIELGEVETNILDISGIKQCVVAAKGEANPYLVAYVVVEDAFDRNAIRKHLQTKLPDYMVPQFIIKLDYIPLTPNGKADKKALPSQDASEFIDTPYKAPQEPTEKLLANIWKELLYVNRVGIYDNFFDLGGNSILAQKMVSILRNEKYLLPVTTLYKQPFISAIAAFLDGREIKDLKVKKKRTENRDVEVAIIGMAGRFPGADTIEELWSVLRDGKETIHFFQDNEIDDSVSPSTKNRSDYVKARGILQDAANFDAAFFGISPNIAELMDPQQRIFLEVSWEALERSGYASNENKSTIGVFAGCGNNTYYTHNVISNEDKIETVGSFQTVTVNDKDYVSSRVAYALNLKGPAVTVQSACSTSLLAVAQAVESIRKGQCDIALAGGVAINSPINIGHLYEEGAMLSSDGHTRTFDAEATGTVFSDGAGVVVLKDKSEAIKDGDIIYAIIKGTGINNDGGGKGSFTAPSPDGQAAAITMAIDDAGISASDISYIEAHGTATPLGDPIEIEGLNIAFGDEAKGQHCYIGSIKSNLGHLTIAAGVAGLIKTVLSLHYKQLPPSINYHKPNPNIDFGNSAFEVNTRLRDWKTDKIRRAGVSSFGVGGTNVHIVLEEAIWEPEKPKTIRPLQLVCWSAKSDTSLAGYGHKLAEYASNKRDVNLEDLAYNLHTSRKNFNFRKFILCDNINDLPNQIAAATKLNSSVLKEIPDKVVFMFPGQGAQHINMAKDLYLNETVFRDALDECAVLLSEELNENILSIIYPEVQDHAAEEKIKNTRYSQPALFSIGYALGKLWMSWGIFPDAFIGHSIGEFVAAYFSGILSLKDALKIIADRGKLMSELPSGSMLSVRASVEEISSFLSEKVSLAAVNSPNLCVLSGAVPVIDALCNKLDDKGFPHRLLATSHAFHSHMMDPVVPQFERIVDKIQLHIPSVPIVSSVTGDWLKDEEATSPSYWAQHLRSTVVFSESIKKLTTDGYGVFIEVGPGSSAATLARQQATGKSLVIVSSLEKEQVLGSSYHSLLKALGNLWLSGVQPNWDAFYNSKRPVPEGFPTYSFDKKRFWVNPANTFLQPRLSVNQNPEQETTALESPVIKPMRKEVLLNQIKDILENVSGVEMQDIKPNMSFIEIGLDSLLLTQIAITLKKEFKIPITFRQLNEQYDTLESLALYLDTQLPEEVLPPKLVVAQQPRQSMNSHVALDKDSALDLINQQLQLLAKQVSLLQGDTGGVIDTPTVPMPSGSVLSPDKSYTDISPEEAIEIKKPFGATAKIERNAATLSNTQQHFLDQLILRYTKKTQGSKNYTEENRLHTADPRVVSGFRPATKELVYPIVVKKSKGSRLWDIDGNEYIDALNGFGSNMFGNQPDFIKEAMLAQIEKGYEIGPQHELTGPVSKLIAEFTGFERVGLCNTGSEAVLGAMRIARTVTGRSTIVAFTGSYHGIVDEVIVRGTKKLRSFPAASGIMPESVQNMLILDYGTDESLRIIKERANEIAAVLVEPIQSRRPEFQPVDFLKAVRAITLASGTALIFDEVISGFRFHPGGAQAMFGIKADIATYGKVIGGGLSIGAIAGNHRYLDALDGGAWRYGDDSAPEVGVTYFAGTFVRHPLALACAKASLEYMKEKGPALQASLNDNTQILVKSLNDICIARQVPLYVVQFGSLWKIKYKEEFPYSELLFTLMREKGIHILDGFPCFLTTAHTEADITQIIEVFEASLAELKGSGFMPESADRSSEQNTIPQYNNFDIPPLPDAKLGKDSNGNPAWFINDKNNPGVFLQINTN